MYMANGDVGTLLRLFNLKVFLDSGPFAVIPGEAGGSRAAKASLAWLRR